MSPLLSTSYIETAVDLVCRGIFGVLLVKVDMKAAFWLISINPDSHYLLGCYFDGAYSADLSLPVGHWLPCPYFKAFSTFL